MTAPLGELRANAVLEMLRGAQLPRDETTDRLRWARDPDYWRNLNPQLSVEQRHDAGSMEPTPLSDSELDGIVTRFRQEGYLATTPLIDQVTITAMRTAIESVHSHGWPEAFAFVYDEFWLAPRAQSLSTLLTALLGPGYHQLPHIWGHYVQPGSSGWTPHMDGPDRPGRVTIWIALSDAPLDGSCMYLVPSDRTPPEVAANFQTLEVFERRQLNALLQHARALPAPAGAVLGWHQQVIHWGAPSYRSTTSRISCSQEFIGASETPAASELPLVDPRGALPSLEQRLNLIATAILAYQTFEPLFIRYADLAGALQTQ